MRVIQTWYKGIKFRSRTEARWAVLFDKLSIKWDYEIEGFVLSDGTCYLPDFWLPEFEGGMYVEVKGKFTQEEKELCRNFCYESGHKILWAEGIPSIREYVFLVKNEKEDCVDYFTGLPNACSAQREHRMFAETGFTDITTYELKEQYLEMINVEYLKAIRDARSARFEHGESGSFPNTSNSVPPSSF